jgi:hypothetical protein
MNEDDLTRPERSCEMRAARAKRSEVLRRGVCGCCLHRDRASEAFGRAVCSVPGRSYPQCVESKGTSFALDESTIKPMKRAA